MKPERQYTKRQHGGEETEVPCAALCPSCTTWKQKYEELKDTMVEIGLMTFEMLDDKQKYSLVVMQYVRKQHGGIKVSPGTLHMLKPEVKRDAMDYLHSILGGNPRRKDIVHEVFREPRKRRQDCFEEYGKKSLDVGSTPLHIHGERR